MSEAFIAATCCCLEGGGGDDDDDPKEEDPPICDAPGSTQPPGATCEPIRYLLVAGKINYNMSGGVTFKTTGETECLECFNAQAQGPLGCNEVLPEVRTTYNNKLKYDYAQVFTGNFKCLMSVDPRGNAYLTSGPNGLYPPRIEFNFGSSVTNENFKEQVSRICPRFQGDPVPPPFIAGSVAFSEYVDNRYVSEAPYSRVFSVEGNDPYFDLKREVIWRSCDAGGDQIYGCEELSDGCYVRWTFGGQFKHPKTTLNWTSVESYENPYGLQAGPESVSVNANCERICDTFYGDDPSPDGASSCTLDGFVFRTYAKIDPQASTCPKSVWEKPVRTKWGFLKNSTNPVYSTEGANPCEYTQGTECRGISSVWEAAAGWPQNDQFNYGNILHFGDFGAIDSPWDSNSCSPKQPEDMEGEDGTWTTPNHYFLPVQHWSDDCGGVCRGNGQNHFSEYTEDFNFKCVPQSSGGGSDPCPCLIYGETGSPQPPNNSCGDCRGKPDKKWESIGSDGVKITIGTHQPLEDNQLPDPASW